MTGPYDVNLNWFLETLHLGLSFRQFGAGIPKKSPIQNQTELVNQPEQLRFGFHWFGPIPAD